MLKKIMSMTTAAILAVGALAAGITPAHATVTYQSNAGTVAARSSIQGYVDNSGNIVVPSGLASFRWDAGLTIGNTKAAALSGHTLAFSAPITDPSSNVISANGSGLYAYPQLYIGVNGGPGNVVSGTSYSVPNNTTSISINWITPVQYSNFGSSTPPNIPGGTYNVSPSITDNGTPMVAGTDYSLSQSYTYNQFSTTVVNPNATLSPYNTISLYTCIDSTAATGALTARTIVDGTASVNNSPTLARITGTGTNNVLVNATIDGNSFIGGPLMLFVSETLSNTASASHTYDLSVRDSAGTEVTKNCAGAAPSITSITGTPGSVSVQFSSVNYAYYYKCNLYASSDQNTVVASVNTSMLSCTFGSLPVGNTYVVKTQSISQLATWQVYNGLSDAPTAYSAESSPSNQVTIPAASITVTAPSGLTTAGKASVTATQVSSPTSAASYYAASDGNNGLLQSIFTSAPVQNCVSSCDTVYSLKLRHLTPSGLDSSFGSTGTIAPSGTYTVSYANASMGYVPRASNLAWFGARDHWATALQVDQTMNPTVNLYYGTFGSSTISTLQVAGSTLGSYCTSNFTNSALFGTIVAVSMASSVPVYQITCTASASSALGFTPNGLGSLSAFAYVTFTNATTINTLAKVGGLDTNINAVVLYTSTNPAASGSATALTLIATNAKWTDSTHESVVSRKIIRIPASANPADVTSEDSAYSTQTSLYSGSSNAAEPTLTVAPNNNGTIYLLETINSPAAIKVATLGTTGDITTPQAITFDSASSTAFTNVASSTLSLNGVAQAAANGAIYFIRTTRMSPYKTALMKVVLSDGTETTGEVVAYTKLTGSSTSTLMDTSYITSTGNAYWYYTPAGATDKSYMLKWVSLDYVPLSSDASATFTVDGTAKADGESINVANGTSSVTVVVTPTESHATYTVSGNTGLQTGNNTVTIVVTAQDGTTAVTSHITVVVAQAQQQQASNVTTASFAIDTHTHVDGDTIHVADGTTSVSISVTPAAGATYVINGNSGMQTGNNSLSVVVTAEDGVTTHTYHFTIVVDAPQQQQQQQGPTVITHSVISGFTAPRYGDRPQTSSLSDSQWTATIDWDHPPQTFDYDTSYGGVVHVTAASGYTLTGVSSNFFTIEGATTLNNSDSGDVVFSFPALSRPSDDARATISIGGVDRVDGETITATAGARTISVSVATSESHATSVVTGSRNLQVGNNTVTVVVTAQDGVTTHTWTFTVIVPVPTEDPMVAVVAAQQQKQTEARNTIVNKINDAVKDVVKNIINKTINNVVSGATGGLAGGSSAGSSTGASTGTSNGSSTTPTPATTGTTTGTTPVDAPKVDIKPLTKADLASAGFEVKSDVTAARVTDAIVEIAIANPEAQITPAQIAKIVYRETIVDKVADPVERVSVRASDLIRAELMTTKTTNKAEIIVTLRALPSTSLDTYAEVKKAIADAKAKIDDRKARWAAALAKHEALQNKLKK